MYLPACLSACCYDMEGIHNPPLPGISIGYVTAPRPKMMFASNGAFSKLSSFRSLLL